VNQKGTEAMKPKRAAEVVKLLRDIDAEFASYHAGSWLAGEDSSKTIEKLNTLIGELRDALWHEMPRKLARGMDEEDGLPAGRGQWP
jgi:hypothetical protein